MAFLAINDINVSAQLGSLISTALALGSFITGLLQVIRYRTRTGASSDEVANYLHSTEGRIFGLLPLAINYSLPYALLIWSVVFFGVAIIFYSTQFWVLMTGKATILGMAIVVITPIVWTTLFRWNSHYADFMPHWRNWQLPRVPRIRWSWRSFSSKVRRRGSSTSTTEASPEKQGSHHGPRYSTSEDAVNLTSSTKNRRRTDAACGQQGTEALRMGDGSATLKFVV